MERQDDPTSNDWFWFDQMISGSLTGTPAAQPDAPMDLVDGNGTFPNSPPVHHHTTEGAGYFDLGSEPVSRALSENSGHSNSGEGGLFVPVGPDASRLFINDNGNPYHGVFMNHDSVTLNPPPNSDGSSAFVTPMNQQMEQQRMEQHMEQRMEQRMMQLMDQRMEPRMERVERRLENVEGRFDNLEGRFDKVDHRNQLIYEITDSIKGAMKRWSVIVNKTLLEIAKAVGIPLYYNDGVAGVLPSYEAGASIRFTAGLETSSEHEKDHARGGDAVKDEA